tara:strand:- start:745 stop:1695 length:951 start_codon:yes stop_codon:yes gene_type:complete
MIALVGYGYWGKNLARVFKDKLKYIIDKEEDALNKAKHDCGKDVYYDRSLTNVLKTDKSIKAVLIATKPESHLDIAKLCLKYNKHIWIEKPICATYEEALELQEYHNKVNSKLRVMVDHTFLFHPAINKLSSIDIGEPLYYDSHRISLGLFQKDVDVVKDLAIHDLAIIKHLYPLMQLKKKTIVKHNHVNKMDNQAILCLEFEQGGVKKKKFTATINCNWVSPVKKREIILTGTKKSVIYDDIDINKIKIYNTGKIGEDYNINQLGDMKSPKLDTSEALVMGKRNFLECIENECKPMTSDLNFSVDLMRWIDDTIL